MAGRESDVDLRQVARRLRALRDRLADVARQLELIETPHDGNTRPAIGPAQVQLAEVAAELIQANGRLQRFVTEASLSTLPTGVVDTSESRGAVEVLRGVIECVIADCLEPAIEALLEFHLPSDDARTLDELPS